MGEAIQVSSSTAIMQTLIDQTETDTDLLIRRGALIFIDEADSFLEDRDTLSPARIRVLNEFIYHTGTESRDVSFLETQTNFVLCSCLSILVHGGFRDQPSMGN